MASSSLLDEHKVARNVVSLLSGFLGVLATIITAMRNAAKFDVKVQPITTRLIFSSNFLLHSLKAELFRTAAGQYRLMATRIEERLRTVRSINYLSYVIVRRSNTLGLCSTAA